MNRLTPENHGKVRRASIVGTLAAMTTTIAVFGPAPSTSADLIHHALGRDTTVELTLEQLAAETYHRTVFAHCAPTPGSYGQSSPRYHTVRLNPSVCDVLGKIIANPEAVDPNNSDTVIAILATAHELSHVDGAGLHKEDDEGVTQCLGAQRSEQVAEELGIPIEKAKIIGDLAASAADAPPKPEYTIPSGCVDGGVYDINAPGNHFPEDPIAAFLKGH